jgi:uncharacterized coiled-coil protein SlyX
MNPFPIEKEFRVLAVKQRLHELTREDLEEFLAEALSTLTKLAHQVTELRDYVEKIEGKTG